MTAWTKTEWKEENKGYAAQQFERAMDLLVKYLGPDEARQFVKDQLSLTEKEANR